MMRPACLAAALLVAAGLAAGYESDAVTAAPRHHGDDLILAADLHVHSFPGDGSLTPSALAREAERRGLDVVALTNHNQRLSWRLTSALGLSPGGALLIPGEELTSSRFHLAMIGTSADVSWRQNAAAAAAAAHALGGAAIAAHPARSAAEGYADNASLDAIDGVEVAHPFVYVEATGRAELEAFYSRARARKPAVAAIGSTDFHFFAPVGLCRTFVFARERTAPAVVDAIRRGRTVACDTVSGLTYGPPELVPAVEGMCRGAAQRPSRAHGWRDPASAVLVWCGLAALVVLGVRPRILPVVASGQR